MSRDFPALVSRYGQRYRRGRFRAAAIRWAPMGMVLGGLCQFLFRFRGPMGTLPVLAAVILPSLAAGAIAHLRTAKVDGALSWLDGRLNARQVLQAAWENRHGASAFSGLLQAAGTRILTNTNPLPPLPGPSTTSKFLALGSTALLLFFILLGPGLLDPRGADLAERGRAFEVWAESWAEDSRGSGQGENQELANRMERLARRMADGSIGDKQAQRTLQELSADIEQRRDDLVRENLAQFLVDDLNIDKETASQFRTRRRRLSSEALAEMSRAVNGNSFLPKLTQDHINQLLSDPEFRDQLGNGTPELIERLTDALKEELESDDSRIAALDQAADESQKALNSDEKTETDSPEAAGGTAENGDSQPQAGGSDSEGGEAMRSDKEDQESQGSGRGRDAMRDQFMQSPSISPDSEAEIMRLPPESMRTGSWRTLVRAYTEDGEAALSDDATLADLWRRDVESAMNRQDIPPPAREYIRDYFLALDEEQ